MKYEHPRPRKAQLSPHKHPELICGVREQLNLEIDKSPPLEKEGTRRIQGIVGELLYYARAVEKKLLVSLSSIGFQ